MPVLLVLAVLISVFSIRTIAVDYAYNFTVDLSDYSKWFRFTGGGIRFDESSSSDSICQYDFSSSDITITPEAGQDGGYMYTIMNLNLDRIESFSYDADTQGIFVIKFWEQSRNQVLAIEKGAGTYSESCNIREQFAALGVSGNVTVIVQLHTYYGASSYGSLTFSERPLPGEYFSQLKLNLSDYSGFEMSLSGGGISGNFSEDGYGTYEFSQNGLEIISKVWHEAGVKTHYSLNLDKIAYLDVELDSDAMAYMKIWAYDHGSDIYIDLGSRTSDRIDIAALFAAKGVYGMQRVQIQIYAHDSVYKKIEFVRETEIGAVIVENDESEYVVYAQNTDESQFAAQEFIKYVYMMTGYEFQTAVNMIPGQKYIIFGDADFASFALDRLINTQNLMYDGFQIIEEAGNLIFTGSYQRSVLYAVYDFLEKNGCIFPRAVRTEEYIPVCPSLFLANEYFSNPDIETRGISEAPFYVDAQWAENFSAIVDISAKNKINTAFIHAGVGFGLSGPLGDVAGELLKRGMEIQTGGHGVQEFVPRSLFDTRPELFRMANGQRTPTGNICSSSQDAIDMITGKVIEYFTYNPDVTVFRTWFEDVVGGSWCECPFCEDITPTQQQYNVLAEVNRALREVYPNKKIDMLLYHETIEDISEIDAQLNPGNETKLDGLFAPRERCYAHSIDDPECETNAIYMQALEDTVALFGADSCSAFEYYADMILYVKNETNFARTIADDIKAYKAAGLRKIAPLSFDNYSTWAYGLNSYVFARHSWDSTLDVDDTIKKYSDGIGFEDDSYVDYLSLIESASASTYAYCGYGRQYADIRELPLEPIAYYGEHVEKLEQSLIILGQARLELDEMILGANMETEDFLEAEDSLLTITTLETEAMYKRMLARYLNKTQPGVYSKAELWALGNKVIENQEAMKVIIAGIDNGLKGVIGTVTFPGHLCDDQINVMWYLMNTELNMYGPYEKSPPDYLSLLALPNDGYNLWYKMQGRTILQNSVTEDSAGKYSFSPDGIRVESYGDYTYIFHTFKNLDLRRNISLIYSVESQTNWAIKFVINKGGTLYTLAAEKVAGTYENFALNLTEYMKSEGITGVYDVEIQLVSIGSGGNGTLFKDLDLVSATYLKGDADGDGITNSLDIISMKKHVLGIVPFTAGSKAFAAADINGDNSVSVSDIISVKKMIVS